MMFRVDCNPAGGFFKTAGHIFERYPWAVQHAQMLRMAMNEHDRRMMDVEVVRIDDDGTETPVWRNGGRL